MFCHFKCPSNSNLFVPRPSSNPNSTIKFSLIIQALILSLSFLQLVTLKTLYHQIQHLIIYCLVLFTIFMNVNCLLNQRLSSLKTMTMSQSCHSPLNQHGNKYITDYQYSSTTDGTGIWGMVSLRQGIKNLKNLQNELEREMFWVQRPG